MAGHTRVLAAKQLGLTEVPVLVASDLRPAQVKAYRLGDNRVADETSWDAELLAIEIEGLMAIDVDLAMSGFDAKDLKGMGVPEGCDEEGLSQIHRVGVGTENRTATAYRPPQLTSATSIVFAALTIAIPRQRHSDRPVSGHSPWPSLGVEGRLRVE